MKNILVVSICLLLSACLFPIIPTITGGETIEGVYAKANKHRTIAEVKGQLRECGFPIPDYYSNEAVMSMSDQDYLKANICMEKHGYRQYKHKSICHTPLGKSKGGNMCQAWLKEFKR